MRDTNAPAMPATVRETYARKLTRLLALPCGSTAEATPAPHLLLLSIEARTYMGWLARYIERELGEFGELGGMQDWGGKLLGATARIAGLLHMAEHAETQAPWDIPVTGHTVEDAWTIGEYLTHHARAAFGEMCADAATGDARYLLRWLRHHCDTTQATSVTRRDRHQGNKGGRFPKPESLDAPLSMLVDYGYLRRVPRANTPGRPSDGYEVNPLWLSQNSQNPQNPVLAIA